MTGSSAHYGLERVSDASSGHAVIVLHGIRQTRDALKPFAEMIAGVANASDVFVYGYNHTLALEENGELLARAIEEQVDHERVDLVGYSMGGLVARLAASERLHNRIRTVVTLATPNRGSISNAELSALGQVGRSIFQLISPIVPRSRGIMDLTRAARIMSDRRDRIYADHPQPSLSANERRYASVPGLFYHVDKAEFEFGPSLQMTGVQAALKLAGLKIKLVNMKRSHDGIVTERSNNLANRETHDWSEVDLASPGPDGAPTRCHAVIDSCRNHDHSSILGDKGVAGLTASLLLCDDWRLLKTEFAHLRNRVRLYPFDAD